MSFNFSKIEKTDDYSTERFNIIANTEEGGKYSLLPYNDGVGLVTIGMGFNLSDDNVRKAVFAKMGITDSGLIENLSNYQKNKSKNKRGSDQAN